MKKIYILLLILLVSSLELSAQHFPLLSHYEQNMNLLNPAYVPSDKMNAKLIYRNMWTGLVEAPKSVGINLLYRYRNMNFGMFVLNDKAGIFNQNLVHLNYSYRLQLSKKLDLSLGISGGFDLYGMKFEELNLQSNLDPILQSVNNSAFMPDFNIGFVVTKRVLQRKKRMKTNKNSYYFGASVQHLTSVVFESDLLRDDSYLSKHFNLMAGFRHRINKEFELEESILLKYVSNVPFQADVMLKVFYLENYWLGISYRSSNDITMKLGLEFNNFAFGYAYDYSINRNIFRSSNEIFLAYRIPYTRVAATSIKFN